MKENFKKWLIKNDLFDLFNKNTGLQSDLLKDFKLDQIVKNMPMFLKWLVKNPEIAEQEYPDFYNSLVKRIKDWPSFVFTEIIDGQAESAAKGIERANKAYPVQRKKELLLIKETLKEAIHLGENSTDEIILDAYNKNKDVLHEALAVLETTEQTVPDKQNPELDSEPFKKTKTLPEYLMHKNRDLLAQKLKAEFTTEKGKGIKLMIKALERFKNISHWP